MTWYAIRTAPQRELTVHAMLSRKGYAVYLPVETRERRRAKGGRDEISVPMFSGYLFVRYPFSWPHLRAERHIIGIVSVTNDGIASPIDDAQIERLMHGAEAAIARVKASKPRALKTGDLAKVANGPLVGKTVQITNIKGKRARVLLAMFGREVDVGIEALEAA